MKLSSSLAYTFPTDLEEILKRIDTIAPRKYASSRNYIDGAVTQLSPYISRGVISTQFVFNKLLEKNEYFDDIEKITQELAWRDYWQLIWVEKGPAIDSDLKNKQTEVENNSIPKAILEATTGIEAIDSAITALYKTGYLHNHIRMYIAAITCNMAHSHWHKPAQWMYFHLIDGDWASNALSWQWVAGSNSSKKYVANQENINKYGLTDQKNTWLDVPYERFTDFKTPEILGEIEDINFTTILPQTNRPIIEKNIPTLVYNYYNLDPLWLKDDKATRILLLEPSHFEKYPVSETVLEFALELAKNIPRIQVFVGEFDALLKCNGLEELHFKEHPTASHYKGTEHSRDWMTDVEGYFPSFFKFWNRAKKQLKRQIN
jgi:deoxyribodipyrimidine photo-lyase